MSDVSESKKTRLLLVDDDPFFGRIVKQEAAKRGISVIIVVSLSNPELLAGQKFDGAIVDFDLGDITGPELGFQLEKILGDIPIILVSAKQRVEVRGKEWPPCIKGFVQKELGHAAILESILGACAAKDRAATPIRQAK